MILTGAAFVILAVVMIALQNRSVQQAQEPQATYQFTSQVPRVTLDEAREAYDSKQAVFLDVRSNISFNESHIVGAVNIPENELSARVSELDPDDWIITYCT